MKGTITIGHLSLLSLDAPEKLLKLYNKKQGCTLRNENNDYVDV